ncbi:myeloid leukemia factor isoform X2 [Chrysoperla carnea]|uniref:myeloid leukemia factor isoform X2 n=1 Tax=Chrysoperla carnea TaxID=189513 RepID=UPI001D099774|nr:myeloid leukemia factor isoform X2 [Chrysoperla carnea]
MSFMGGLMGDFDDDPFFGAHMRSMRQMNNMMNSLFADPFGMMGIPALTNGPGRGSQDSLMPFGFPGMNLNINRLLGGNGNCHSYSSSSVVRMTSGPDGKPQVYRASASTRTGPGGIRETQRSVQDSRTGTKKLAIGHHIGERAHVIEREQNLNTGDQEEREEFINLDEEEAETFNKEWENKARVRPPAHSITGAHRPNHRQLALPSTAGPTATSHRRSRLNRTTGSPIASPRRALRTTTVPNTSSSTALVPSSRTPYSPPGQTAPNRRHQRNIKTVSGPPDL